MQREHQLMLGAAIVLAALPLAAEEPAAEGVNSGNYNIQQSVEVGGRAESLTGNQSVYDTFVNLHSGVRLYDYTLALHSLNHSGSLFDELSFTNFGYGGDPYDVSRLKVSKDRWYDFTASFRRDKNFWDYNLLANPLNPPSSNPSLVLSESPHSFNSVRRMSDFRLVLRPQGRVRVHLDYSHDTNQGPSFSSLHVGTDTQLFQQLDSKVDLYRAGVDVRLWPRTSVSYDQFVSTSKDNTSWTDQNLGFTLANGVPVDLGVSFNTAARQPCGTPLIGRAANPGCAGYLAYNRSAQVQSTAFTEQLSFQSNSIQNLNMSGRVSYSSTDGDTTGFMETFLGNDPRTLGRGTTASGPAEAQRVSVTADWAATYRLSEQFRLVDTFRFDNFRVPGNWSFAETTLFAGLPLAAGGVPSLLVPPGSFSACPPPYTSPTCPQHNGSSGADLLDGISSRFLGQDSKYNTIQLEFDASKRFGARAGYRYAHRDISDYAAILYTSETFGPGGPAGALRGDCAQGPGAGCVAQPGGLLVFSGFVAGADTSRVHTIVNENSGLFGLWARPTDELRLSFDLEVFSADNSFTRISPRSLQHYKLRGSYKPRKWASIALAANLIESKNDAVQVDNVQHNRSYAASVTLEPTDKFNVDFGYDYNDVYSAIDICYVLGFGPPPRGSLPCPAASPSPIFAVSTYTNKVHFAYANVLWKPQARVTATAGYSVISTNGTTLILNPNAPPGPLQYNYHRPTAGLSVDLVRRLTLKAAWSYYDYKEKAVLDPTGPRSFSGSLFDFTLRYAF